MDEEFGSFVVTDPDLVDEGIDVSGLRTETDINRALLGNVAPGIQYEGIGFSPTALSDLSRFYQFGLPTRSVSQPTTPPATGGGGGGGTSPGTGVTTPTPPDTSVGVNTPEEQRLIDAGIGVQLKPGSPISSPAEGMPPTQQELDEFNRRPVTPVSPPGQPIGPTGMLPQTSTPFMVPGALGVDPLEKDDVLSGAITAKDAADPGFLSKIGLGQFDPAEAFVKTAINAAVGKPVTLLIDILKDLLPPQDPRAGALKELYPDRTSAGTIASGLMTGYNPVSGGFLNTITGGRVGDPTTYGLQEAYQDRIDTVENTLKNKYGMTTADIADVRAGSYKGDVDSDLLQRLVDLDEAKAKEKARLDLFSGDVDDRDQMLEDLSTGSLQGKINLGIQAADDDKGDDMFVPSQPVTGVKGPPSQISGPQVTTPVTGVTRPGTVLGKPGIERFDDAEASIDMFDDLPPGASTTGTPIDSLNPINRQQHFDNTEKLKDAVRAGEITPEEYNRLSAFDARKTMGLGPVTGTAATIGYQGVQTLAGDQTVGDMIGDIGRNIQGVSGNITPEEQVKYQEIITGEKIYRDPILGMVDQPKKGTLAGIGDLPDISDEFAMFDLPEPTPTPVGTFDADTFDDDVSLDDFDTTPPAPPSPPTGTGGPPSVISRPDPSPPTGTGGPPSVISRPDPTPAPKDIPDRGRGGPPSVSSRPAPSLPSYGPPSQSGGGGGGGNGGGGGGGGKIVCTMMNESYGFGSFRNKIWLRHSKGLAPEYQKGYHKIFLPLVRLSKKNIVLKKVLEHIAVHRTIDIRQESRGKVHLLGRVYRKILEPICYWVGRHG